MTLSVTNQAYIFFLSVAGGIASGFLFDCFRVLRRFTKVPNVLIYIEDIIFWILVAIMFFAIIFFNNDGELRWYEFLGSIIGVILYIMTISEYIMKFMLTVTTYIIKIIGMITSPAIKFIVKGVKKVYLLIGRNNKGTI